MGNIGKRVNQTLLSAINVQNSTNCVTLMYLLDTDNAIAYNSFDHEIAKYTKSFSFTLYNNKDNFSLKVCWNIRLCRNKQHEQDFFFYRSSIFLLIYIVYACRLHSVIIFGRLKQLLYPTCNHPNTRAWNRMKHL